jgi:hypothetical protein
MKTFRIISLFLCLCVGVFAQNAVRITDSRGNETVVAASGIKYNSGLTALTTTPTALTSTTLKVQVIHCKSNSSTATTITIKDGNDVVYFDAVSLAASSVMVAHYGAVGLTYTNGIKVSAAANSTISCQVEGVTQ